MDFKDKLSGLWKKYNHFTLFLLFIPNTLFFYWLQLYTVPKFDMHMRLDDYIPFVSAFIIPYVYWYFYCLWGYLFFAFYSKKEFKKFIAMIISGGMIACIIYLLFPNGQSLRNVITEHNVFTDIILKIRSTDPPTNVFPSLHCFNSIAINIAVCTSEAFKSKRWRWVRWVAYISTVLICMSTVFIKQHSIADVYGAFIMTIPLYLIIYRPWKKVTSERTVPAGVVVESIAVTEDTYE